MFDIGFFEILIMMGIAVFVIGPQNLPKLASPAKGLLVVVLELKAADQNRQGHHRQQTSGQQAAFDDQHQRQRHVGQVPLDHLMQAHPGSGATGPVIRTA